MALDLLAALIAQTIVVEVRNRANGAPIGSADVVMEGGTPPIQRRQTRSDGQITFAATCSDGIKFWAETPGNPSFPGASAPVLCQPRVRLKLRPSH